MSINDNIYAHIERGRVTDIIPGAMYDGMPAATKAACRQIPDGLAVRPGWQVDGDVFRAPLLPTADLLAIAKVYRREAWARGVVVDGLRIAGDDRTEMRVMLSASAASRDPAWSTQWQDADGLIRTIDGATVAVIQRILDARRNAVAAAYATLVGKVEAGSALTETDVADAFAAL